jgi:uncharacterized membrane protein YGL010W
VITTTSSLSELTTSTIRLLCREIGVVNTARFINQFTTGHGNYTEEREALVGDLTVDEIVAEIELQRSAKPHNRRQESE